METLEITYRIGYEDFPALALYEDGIGISVVDKTNTDHFYMCVKLPRKTIQNRGRFYRTIEKHFPNLLKSRDEKKALILYKRITDKIINDKLLDGYELREAVNEYFPTVCFPEPSARNCPFNM